MEPYKSSAGQGLSIAALVLAILALIISFIPCIGLFAIIPGIVAIILSIVGLSQANKENAAKGLVIAALVISILGTAISILWTVFLAQSIQKDGWLRQQIEKTIEDETGKTIDENWKDFGNDMEKVLEDLEHKTDSSSEKIVFGEQMTKEEYDKFLVDYEKLINEAIKLKKKTESGDVKAMEAYAKVSFKLNGILTKIATSGSKLSTEQAQKLENLNKKYEKELESIQKE